MGLDLIIASTSTASTEYFIRFIPNAKATTDRTRNSPQNGLVRQPLLRLLQLPPPLPPPLRLRLFNQLLPTLRALTIPQRRLSQRLRWRQWQPPVQVPLDLLNLLVVATSQAARRLRAARGAVRQEAPARHPPLCASPPDQDIPGCDCAAVCKRGAAEVVGDDWSAFAAEEFGEVGWAGAGGEPDRSYLVVV